MKIYFLAILLIFNLAWTIAQTTYDRSDFERINQTYLGLEVLQTKLDYIYYSNHSTATPGYSLTAVLSVNKDNYHYRLGEVETLSTAEMTVLVDHEEKKIMLDRSRKNVQQVLFGADLDALLLACSVIKMSQPEPGIKKYELYADLTEIERIDIYFDTQTFLMRRVVLFYNYEMTKEYGGTGEKPRLELVYRLQDTKPTFEAGLFSVARFVQKSGNGYAAVAPFRNYKLLSALK